MATDDDVCDMTWEAWRRGSITLNTAHGASQGLYILTLIRLLKRAANDSADGAIEATKARLDDELQELRFFVSAWRPDQTASEVVRNVFLGRDRPGPVQ